MTIKMKIGQSSFFSTLSEKYLYYKKEFKFMFKIIFLKILDE